MSENPETDYKQYAEELSNFIIPGETTSFLKRLQKKKKDSSNDDGDNDFPLNQIIEPISSTKSKNTGAGIKKIIKRKLGEVVRGDVVASVMKKMGLSLPEASRYVKLHNLY